MKQHIKFRIYVGFLCLLILFSHITIPVYATAQDFLDEAEERKNDPVESNEVENWPQGPLIGAKAAILIEANTGAVLYSKNIDEALFPASITKLMTCLVAVENCPLDEIITVNQSAIDANEPDGSHMSLIAGEQLTLEELLHGILISSANEACNVVAEHIAGSMDDFVNMMNERAAALGCTNTHFVTTNGLHNDDHYVSAHDMALIAQAFFSHDILCRISGIADYHMEENAFHEEHYLHSKNHLLEGQSQYYEFIVGSKTGFTSLSRQTLVSCAERDGMRLICVILMEESPYQFDDTIKLFDYGFSNFSAITVSNYDNSYDINHSDFFNAGNDIFGSTSPIISMDNSSKIILPNNLDFSETESTISYEGITDNTLARINYTYKGMYLGSTTVTLTGNTTPSFTFEDPNETEGPGASLTDPAETDPSARNQIFVNIYRVLIGIVVTAVVIVLLLIGRNILKNYHFEQKRINKIKKRRRPVRRSQPVRKVPAKSKGPVHLNYRKTRKNKSGAFNISNIFNMADTTDKPYSSVRPKNSANSYNNSKPAAGGRGTQNWEKRNDINFDDFKL